MPKKVLLPFHPMLLTQFGAFHEKVQLAAKLKRSRPSFSSSLSAGPYDPPFFICPKLDGARCISYVPRTTSKKHILPFQSCFSRRGVLHPLMLPIERDLWSMRVLAGDSGLTLDGELYIHRPPSPSTLTAFLASAPTIFTATKTKHPPSTNPPSLIPPALQLHIFDMISMKFTTDNPQYLFECTIPSMQPIVKAISRVQTTTAKAYKNTTPIHISEGTSTFILRLRAMTFLFDLVAASKRTLVEEGNMSSTLWDRLGREYDRLSSKLLPNDGAHLVSTTINNNSSSIDAPALDRVSLVQYDLLWDTTLDTALEKVGEYVDTDGYEGAVVRSGMDIYTATPSICGKRTVKTARSGCRSPTAVKLVPHYDREYRLISIARVYNSEEDVEGGEFQVNLECSTDAGVCFRVAASTKDFPSLLQEHHDDASQVFTPGCFVTLKFPAFVSPSSQVPLLPRVKGVRGLTKAHFL